MREFAFDGIMKLKSYIFFVCFVICSLKSNDRSSCLIEKKEKGERERERKKFFYIGKFNIEEKENWLKLE